MWPELIYYFFIFHADFSVWNFSVCNLLQKTQKNGIFAENKCLIMTFNSENYIKQNVTWKGGRILNHTLRAKQQKANLDKLDKILASLPEAQYDHNEEEAPAKKQKSKKKRWFRKEADQKNKKIFSRKRG